uniref:Cyanobacterial aminoacyl-tRNA synthetase CAAD domain-containing protein n=1 Tax=Kalanchoe fedtschenkoi TaxID=63787 RepID=A0A7N0UPX3_KALFE
MELCTSQRLVNLHHRCSNPLLGMAPLRRNLSPSLLQSSPCRVKSGLRLRTLPLRATSEETSTGQTDYVEGTRDAGFTFEDPSPVDKMTQVEVVEPEKPKEEYAPDDQSPVVELMDKLDVKLDTDSTIPILLYGGVTIVSVWLALAVVEAIDAIPVFPKLMEVVGLGFTVWFTSRYLIFKESRDELATKIAELKLKMLGSEWN